ncbi:MAG: phosphatase PAP2 family protein [Promethearchaeota archaeon]
MIALTNMMRRELDWKKLETHLNREKYIQFLILMIGISIGLLLLGIFFEDSKYNQLLLINNQFIFYFFFILARLGSPYAFFIYFIIIYHLYDKKVAKHVFLATSIALFISQFLKDFFQILRPISNIVGGKPIQEGYGFPSGYTITIVVFWGFILFQLKEFQDSKEKLWIWIFSIFLIITIPLSRLIIGVNYFEDIIAGYIVGLTILSLVLLGEAKFRSFYTKSKTQSFFGLGVSLIMWILGAIFLTIIYPDDMVKHIQDLSMPTLILASFSVIFDSDQKFNPSEPGKGALEGYNHKKIWVIVLILVNIGIYAVLYAIFSQFSDFIINEGIRYGLLVISAMFLFPLLNKIIWVIQKIIKRLFKH